MPEIKINDSLMDAMTMEEKEEWCKSDPSGTFKCNQLTQKVWTRSRGEGLLGGAEWGG